ncbi:MAG: DUF885 domain-containing protein [Henriciella sp.]|uniref:DUF885 domain-containing protein n=1 Tax=Henriciella sp. TaxID=1968823 RepID=UPI0032EBE873
MKSSVWILTGLLALASPAYAREAPKPGPVITSEPAAQSLEMAEIIHQYEALTLDINPAAKARSEDRAPRQWPDVSQQHVENIAQRARALQQDLLALEDHTTPEWKILGHLLDDLIMQAEYDTARIPFTGDWGFHAEPFFAASNLRLRNEEEAEAWISRLNDVPRYFSQHATNMRRGVRTGWTSHADPLSTTTEQVREQVVDAPEDSALWAPFETLPEDMDAETAASLRAAGRQAVMRAVKSYEQLLTYLETDYAMNTRAEAGVGSLPGGHDYYEAAIRHHTAGAGYSPEDIHQLGRSEVARIRAEMESVIDEIGYSGTFDEFLAFLRSDPQFYANTPEDLLEKAALISKRLDAILPQYFGRLPRLTYGVEPVPASIAPGYTTGRYSGGNPEEGMSGTYLVNTYALDQRPLYELPALSAHEAVPGHHIQIALAQELDDVPYFRKNYYATAFGEGWGLYAETLAGEAGIYRTPYERFGALSYEMWRACRLVADTGMHWYGWSREEAEACFEKNSALAPLNIQTEVTRYIGWPGQATAYKIGELKILKLRDRAKTALGPDFDIRAFHDTVLGAGSLPLDALETRVDDWIARQQGSAQPDPDVTAP